jgi:hypothetical protein
MFLLKLSNKHYKGVTNLMKIINSLLYGLLFIVLLIIIYFIHVNYFKIDVVFFAALSDVCISIFFIALLLFFIDKKLIFSKFEKLLLIIIFSLLGYILSMSIPALIDRSLSFYMLEKIQQSHVGINRKKFDDLFIKDFVKKYNMIDVRLTEQLTSGTIFIENDCVKLTIKGQMIADFSNNFRRHWLPAERLIINNYVKGRRELSNEELINRYKCE